MKFSGLNNILEILKKTFLTVLLMLIAWSTAGHAVTPANSLQSGYPSLSSHRTGGISAAKLARSRTHEAGRDQAGSPIISEDENIDDQDENAEASPIRDSGSGLALLSKFLSQTREDGFPSVRKLPLYALYCSWKHFLI